MNKKVLEITAHERPGYKPLVDFEKWRVAILNSGEKSKLKALSRVERHLATDEVFVLLKGNAALLIGGIRKSPADRLTPVKMVQGKLFNIKKAVWHATLMKKNAKILIVENRNTSVSNSEYRLLSPKQLKNLRSLKGKY